MSKTRALFAAMVVVPLVLGCTRSGASPGDGSELVRAYVKRSDARYRDVDVTSEDTPRSPLSGLRLYVARPKILDGPVLHCFVRGREVWCDDHPGALARLVATYGLGRDPAQLTDEQWIDLTVFALGSVLLKDAADAKAQVHGLPSDKAALVAAPRAPRKSGVVVTYAAAIVANTSGPHGVTAAGST